MKFRNMHDADLAIESKYDVFSTVIYIDPEDDVHRPLYCEFA